MEYKITRFLSKRGKQMIFVDGYIYNLDKEKGDTIRWRCRNRNCTTHLYINAGTIEKSTPHLHEEESAKFEAINVMQNFGLQLYQKT
jgi:hypothetical protein